MYTTFQNYTPVVYNDFFSDVATVNQITTTTSASYFDDQYPTNYYQDYLDRKLKESEERMANKMYNIISEIIEINMTKEEFIKLLLSDEVSDA